MCFVLCEENTFVLYHFSPKSSNYYIFEIAKNKKTIPLHYVIKG